MELLRTVSDNPSIIWINGKMVDERIDANYYHVNHIESSKTEVPMFRISKYCSLSKQRFSLNKYDKEYFKYIDISNVDINTGISEYQLVNRSEAPSRAKKKVWKNDIIVSTVRPNRNAVSIINSEDDELVVSTGFAVIQCKESIDNYYLFAALKTNNIINQLIRKMSGGLYPAISEKDVMDIEIPIPSSEIQKYIGDKVRKAEQLKEKAKKLKMEIHHEFNELYNIQFEVYKTWYTDPNNLTDRIDCGYNYNYFFEIKNKFLQKGFKVVNFGSLIKQKMSEPQTDSSAFVSEGIPLLRITDIYEDYLDFEGCAKIPEAVYDRLKDFQLAPNDIIFGLSGTIGRAIVVPDDIPDKAITNRRIAKVTLKDPDLAYYVAMFLNSEYGQNQLQREATGGVQSNLRLEDITNIYIPIPNKDFINKVNVFLKNKVILLNKSRLLIKEAKKDVEDLIEGNFDMSKVKKDL